MDPRGSFWIYHCLRRSADAACECGDTARIRTRFAWNISFHLVVLLLSSTWICLRFWWLSEFRRGSTADRVLLPWIVLYSDVCVLDWLFTRMAASLRSFGMLLLAEFMQNSRIVPALVAFLQLESLKVES
jgi:hypothetical protein